VEEKGGEKCCRVEDRAAVEEGEEEMARRSSRRLVVAGSSAWWCREFEKKPVGWNRFRARQVESSPIGRCSLCSKEPVVHGHIFRGIASAPRFIGTGEMRISDRETDLHRCQRNTTTVSGAKVVSYTTEARMGSAVWL
jgi:hypothetical protein